MDRTFHRHFSIVTVCGIVAFAILAFFLFWSKAAILGFLLILVVVILMERMLHTSYRFVRQGHEQVLIIDRGRLAKRQVIRLSEVTKVTPMRRMGGLSHFVMIMYGANRMLAVQPEEEKAFCKELMKRINDYDEEKN